MISSIRLLQGRCPTILHRLLATTPAALEAHKPRVQSRRPKKIFSSDGLELPLVQTRLEDNQQAREVAERQARLVRTTKKKPMNIQVDEASSSREKRPRGQKSRMMPESFKEDLVALPDEDLDDDPEDKLPPGLDWRSLPRFVKVHGWERDSKHLRNLRDSLSHHHKKDDTVVLEGKRLIVDAMRAGFHPSIFVFSRLNLLLGFPFDTSRDLAMYQIPYRNVKAWSELKTPPGFMAAFNRKEIEDFVAQKLDSDTLPITLILDNVRSPDNLGSILRVAAAVGCKRVIAMQGCVDPWQSKVLRAAAGAHLFMPISRDVTWDRVHQHVPSYPQVVLADIARSDNASEEGEEGSSLSSSSLSRKLVEMEEKCKEFHFQEEYEKPPALESLTDKDEKQVDEKVRKSKPEVQHAGYRDYSYYDEDIVSEYVNLPIVSKAHHQFQRFDGQQELVVVIGGETEGVSGRAKKFAHSHLGERLFIPIRSKIDSLNVVSATSVILFEIQKFFTAGRTQ